MVDHPTKLLTCNIFTLILITTLVFYFGYFQISEQHRRDYLIWDHPSTINNDKWHLMVDKIEQ